MAGGSWHPASIVPWSTWRSNQFAVEVLESAVRLHAIRVDGETFKIIDIFTAGHQSELKQTGSAKADLAGLSTFRPGCIDALVQGFECAATSHVRLPVELIIELL